MAQVTVKFCFYGLNVTLVDKFGNFGDVISDLREDFLYFESPASVGAVKLIFNIEALELPVKSKPRSSHIFSTHMCDVYGFSGLRACDYGEGHWSLSESQYNLRAFRFYGSNRHLLYEVIYMAMLSAIGEELEDKGYQRLHALSFYNQAKSTIVFLKTGGGKSTAAIQALSEPKTYIFSDEITLIKEGEIYPFPLRLALRKESAEALKIDTTDARIFERKKFTKKYLFKIPESKISEKKSLNRLVIGQESKITPTIQGGRFLISSIYFIFCVVLGLGLPQMAEHFLRSDNLLKILKFSLSRLRLAIYLLVKCECYKYEVDVNPLTHWQRLKAISSEQQLR